MADRNEILYKPDKVGSLDEVVTWVKEKLENREDNMVEIGIYFSNYNIVNVTLEWGTLTK